MYIAAGAALLIVSVVGLWAFTRGDAPVDRCTLLLAGIPADRDMPEANTAIIKKADLAQAFGKEFRKYQENPLEAQGVQPNYVEAGGAFTVSINEVKGAQAATTWQRLTTTFNYANAPDIGPQTKFKPDKVVAVYKGEVFMSITLDCGTFPTDGGALRELGKLIHQRVSA